MTPYRRGDVLLVWFPHSDLRTFKRRPAVMIQRDGLNTGLPQVVLALVTSNLKRAGHPSRVLIERSAGNGLLTDSVVMTDNIATILAKAIDRRLGRLKEMGRVDEALRLTLGV